MEWTQDEEVERSRNDLDLLDSRWVVVVAMCCGGASGDGREGGRGEGGTYDEGASCVRGSGSERLRKGREDRKGVSGEGSEGVREDSEGVGTGRVGTFHPPASCSM